MDTPRHRLRVLLASLVACLLIAGTAVAAAQDDGADPEPPAEQPAEQAEEPPEQAEDAEDPPEQAEDAEEPSEAPEKKRKKKDRDAEAACEVAIVDDAGNGDAEDSSRAARSDGADGDDAEDAPCEPPRCEDAQVDLAPEADEPNCVDRAQLNRLLADFEAAAAEEAAALEELSAALERLEDLNELLVNIQLRLGEVQLRLAATRADQEYASIRETVASESLADVTAALAAEEDRLREQAVEAYMGGDGVELATAAAVIELEGFTAQQTAREYAAVVIGEQLATVDEADALRSAVVLLADVVVEIQAATAADAKRVAAVERLVDDLVARQRDLVADAEAGTEAIAEKIAEIQARKQRYADELRISGAGGGSIGETLRVRQVGQEAPQSPVGILTMPLTMTRLGSPFGPRIHPIFRDTRLHTGLDLSGASGDPILAAADGQVVMAEEVSGYGNVVVVEHGNTLATLYAHMTADAVVVGQHVSRGELIGFVGSTGYSTGPHLHFEVRVMGTPVNPLLYLQF